MSPANRKIGFLVLASAVILAVLIAGCTLKPQGVTPTPAVTTAPEATTIPAAAPTTPAAVVPATTAVPPATPAATVVPTANQTPAPAPTLAIAINATALTPKTVTVRVGTNVTWTNLDFTPHLVSNEPTQSVGPGKIFMSPSLDQGESYSFTFTTAGVYQYFLVDRPNLIGTITVS